MRKIICSVLGLVLLGSVCLSESYLYIEQTKQINGTYKYCLPKLELNQAKMAGRFFGQKCHYLSEFELGLIYTAPRGSILSLNHHSIEAAWNLGVDFGPVWATYSIGARNYLAGNDDGIPAGVEAYNTARLGIAF